MNSKPWLLATLLGSSIALAAGSAPTATPTAVAGTLTVADLRIDATALPALHHLEVQAEVIDHDRGNPEAPGMILMLRDLGISSSANYKVWLRAEPHPIIAKVKLNVFVDESHAAADMSGRYGPEVRARASPLSLGDESFNLQNRLVMMRIDRVQIELSLSGAPEQLTRLAEAYEGLVRARLDPQ